MVEASSIVAKMTSHSQEESHSDQRMRLMTVSTRGFHVYSLVQGENSSRLELSRNYPAYAGAITAKFAPLSGKFAVIVDQEGIHFLDMRSGKETRYIEAYQVTAIQISPRDTYLITCEKHQSGRNNLIIWNTQTGQEAAMFEFKKQSKDGPKTIKFSNDEGLCGRLSSKHHIDIYEVGNFSQQKGTILANAENLAKKQDLQKIEGKKSNPFWFDGFEFILQGNQTPPQSSPQYLCAWQHSEGLSETADFGGYVYFFDLNSNLEKPKFSAQCSKSQEISVRSSPQGYAVLIWAQNYVDTSGKSYYGEHSLQYIQLQGGKARVIVPVFNAMIHDAKWSPQGDYFIVISGVQPAIATLYDNNANPLFEFGKRYRNTIRFDPFQNAVIIGGFGNLTGEIDIWNLSKHIEYGKTKSSCTVGIEWAPDGLHFMTSVLYERVKVDNEIKLFLANGQHLQTLDYRQDELYEAHWQPHIPGSIKNPDLSKLQRIQEEIKEDAKPKRLFKAPGSNSVFSQILRQEMSKTSEKGPKQVDHSAYKDLMNAQTQQHANYVASSSQNIQQEDFHQSEGWRKDFGSIKTGKTKKQQEQEPLPEPSANFIVEEVKLSKHAKRRSKKKQKIVVCGADQQQMDNNDDDQNDEVSKE